MENGVVKCKYDELRDVRSIRPHPKNANVHTKEQVIRLAELLKYQGIRAPLVISNLSECLGKGHCTLEAIKYNKWETAPVVYQDFDNEEQELAFLHSDNTIGAWSKFDISILNMQIPELDPSFDLNMFGLKDLKLDPSELPEKKKKIKKCPECGHEF